MGEHLQSPVLRVFTHVTWKYILVLSNNTALVMYVKATAHCGIGFSVPSEANTEVFKISAPYDETGNIP